jgi:hypothetical protein
LGLLVLALGVALGGRASATTTELHAPSESISPFDQCSVTQNLRFGDDVAVGDLNGDGLDDILVSPGWVIYASGGGSFDDPRRLKNTSSAVAIGDFNHDGLKDAVVFTTSGILQAYYGRTTKLTEATTADWTRNVMSTGAVHSLAVADPNADGYDDLVVGASGAQMGYVYYGRSTGLRDPTSPPDFSYQNAQYDQDENGTTFRYQLSGLGAVSSRDGIDCAGTTCGAQFAFGAPSTSIDVNHDGVFASNEQNMGAVFVAPRTQLLSGEKRASSFFGFAAATAGDVNHDGEMEFLASAHGVGSVPPKVFLYMGTSTFAKLDLTSPWVVSGSAPFTSAFGAQVGSLGDLNHDTFGDIFISDTQFDTIGGRNPTTALGYWGRVLIWMGGASSASNPSGLGAATTGSATAQISATSASGYGFGSSVVAANFDGDGNPDLVVGDPRRASFCIGGGSNQFVEIGGVHVYRSPFAVAGPRVPIPHRATAAVATLLFAAGAVMLRARARTSRRPG